MQKTEKIVITGEMAQILLETLKAEKVKAEERLVDIEIKIEELEKSIRLPIPMLDKKEDDVSLTCNRVLLAVSKHSGNSAIDLAEIIMIELNMDITKGSLTKMKNKVYQHLWQMQKKGQVMSTRSADEKGKDLWFPTDLSSDLVKFKATA